MNGGNALIVPAPLAPPRVDGRRPLRGSAKASEARGAVRRPRALELRIQGKTYEQIGTALGISRQAAHEYVQTALALSARESAESADQLRQIELERCDRMLAALWPKIDAGEELAIVTALRVSKRRAELLGLDAPEPRELLGANGPPTVNVFVVKWEPPDPAPPAIEVESQALVNGSTA